VNIKMRYLVAIAVGMLLVANTAASDDKMVVAGAGTASCGEFIADTKNNETLRDTYFLWAQGFLSSLNFKHLRNWESATDLSDPDALKLWIENYCEENPLSIYAAAVAKLWSELRIRQGLEPDPLIKPEN